MLKQILKVAMMFTCIFTTLLTNAQNKLYTLEECISIALENNISVQRGRLDLRSAQINLNQSKMDRLPDLTLGAGYGNNWGRSIDPTSNQFITTKINQAGFNGSSSVTLFNGFQLSNAIRQSQINMDATSNDVKKIENDVSLSVATLYVNVIFNRELTENAKFQLSSTNEQLIRTSKLVDAGSLPITNLLDLQAQLATNEVNLVNAENEYNLAVLQLKQALLLPGSVEMQLEAPDVDVENIETLQSNAEEIYKTAELNQPEIKSADLRIQEAEYGYRISKGAYAPRLSLNGSFSTNYSSAVDVPSNITGDPIPVDITATSAEDPSETIILRSFYSPVIGVDPDYPLTDQFGDNLSRSLSLNLSVPVFNRWRTRSDVQRSVITKQRAEVNAREVRNQLRQSIESAYNDLIAAAKSHAASVKQVKALEESHRVIQNQYNLGAVNFVDFQVAANNLFIARSDLVRAKYDYLFKQKILDFYLGRPLRF